MHQDVIVKKSKISGKGVFAARNFKKGEIVMQWDLSKTLTDEEVAQLPEKEKNYIAHMGGKNIVQQPPARFVNHSCEANTFAKNFCDIAKRDIKKGEEITADYTEDSSGLKMKCNCGSKKCKGTIKA